ncbi:MULTISPECIES: dihydrofolate reductase family protein [Mammaliicoccus]|uniref:dihydrofolate reductase family protein n=1 Tax=Mammaliicoccus TaxID=2803850 RepID=UPI000E057ED8|nr:MULTISPECIES: dihydrofolate reductase family protein [Mammaliicoccus]MEB7805544.1 dihydrofolate reductase family protein [Mammaliicoccus fleurettii]RTX86398.1 dihydrofolate reductase [Mammaliicoccus fleurettii]SUM36868.1 dihydrofolate reductase [Mammaliicoccus fleurettii]HCN59574.1 dihydrofolate reductase [Staphylococcus sp.]
MIEKDNSRKIILDLAVTLDGFIEGENGEIDWCIMDPEMNFDDFLDQIDTIFYGRKSYEMWGDFQPSLSDSEDDKAMWSKVHSKEKYVFSKKFNFDDYHVNIIRDDIVTRVNEIKRVPGKDIWLYGGSSLITSFVNYGLVDEFRLSVHPIVLGKGKPLFIDIEDRQELKLINTRTFHSGVIQLIYRNDE